MRPKRTPLLLPHGTGVVVVDAVKAFMHPDGTFVRCYGTEDAKPVCEVLERLREMLLAWQHKARPMECRSIYKRNQFTVPGLEELCTEENAFDRESCLPPGQFEWVFDKTDNSLLSAGEAVIALLRQSRNLIVTGVTTTSCVRKTVEDCVERFGDSMRIIVPGDAVASRVEKAAEQAALLKKWGSRTNKNVMVVDSWRDIAFEGRPFPDVLPLPEQGRPATRRRRKSA